MSASAAGKAGKSGAPGGATLDAQLRRAEACLARFSTEPLGHFIAGKAVAGSGEAYTASARPEAYTRTAAASCCTSTPGSMLFNAFSPSKARRRMSTGWI